MGLLRPDDDALALVAGARTWSHAQLAAEATDRGSRLAAGNGRRGLVLVRCDATVGTVLGHLGAWTSGHAVLLVDDGLGEERLTALVDRYAPAWIVHPDGRIEGDGIGAPVAPELRLCLCTSGSTGSPKLVRLSERAVLANAASIAQYLDLGPDERALASLPFHYSYGLSVLHSHLLAGASVVLPHEGPLRPGFWTAFEDAGCTSLAGVPFSYELYERAGWRERELPTLRTMTQAGGRMDPASVGDLHAELRRRGARLVVMYGQTEATARMAYVPPERLADKPGTIGVAIPGGSLELDGDELVFRGPNVMLGYAERAEDLLRGDDLQGVLRTGDLGSVDEDGVFSVTGRSARFAKVCGVRIDLEAVEIALHADGPVAVVGRDDAVLVVLLEAGGRHGRPADVRRSVAARCGLHPRTVEVRVLDGLPRTAAGKVDYATAAARV